MKRFVLPLLLLLSTTSVLLAQKVAWDSTYRPGNYHWKVGLFRSYPHSKNDVVFLGNSITDFNEWQELLAVPQVRNRGISGDITFGVLERLDEVTSGQPSKVFILIGINDISRDIPAKVIVQNYRRIIHRIKAESPRTQIYFQTILPAAENRDDLSTPHRTGEYCRSSSCTAIAAVPLLLSAPRPQAWY